MARTVLIVLSHSDIIPQTKTNVLGVVGQANYVVAIVIIALVHVDGLLQKRVDVIGAEVVGNYWAKTVSIVVHRVLQLKFKESTLVTNYSIYDTAII